MLDTSAKFLTPPAPLERLLARMDRLDRRAHRECRLVIRLISRRLANQLGERSAVESLSAKLHQLTCRGVLSPESVSMGINLARERQRWENRLRGPDTRVSRKVIFEELLLLKRSYQALMQLKAPFTERTLSFGDGRADFHMTAFIDASVRPTVTSAGIRLLVDGAVAPFAELSLPVPGYRSVDAEVHAALIALKTMRACGATRVRLFTDSDSVLDLAHRPARLRDEASTQLRELLLLAIAMFSNLELTKIPRAFNHASDRLAARVLSR